MLSPKCVQESCRQDKMRVVELGQCTSHTSAWLAQSEEHETLNLGVVGSSPTLGVTFLPIFFASFLCCIAKHYNINYNKAGSFFKLCVNFEQISSTRRHLIVEHVHLAYNQI
jgi:hypothetical protein